MSSVVLLHFLQLISALIELPVEPSQMRDCLITGGRQTTAGACPPPRLINRAIASNLLRPPLWFRLRFFLFVLPLHGIVCFFLVQQTNSPRGLVNTTKIKNVGIMGESLTAGLYCAERMSADLMEALNRDGYVSTQNKTKNYRDEKEPKKGTKKKVRS